MRVFKTVLSARIATENFIISVQPDILHHSIVRVVGWALPTNAKIGPGQWWAMPTLQK